ncbi:MAG: class I SAM-dependent methyltransferase [Alphaproteobacteria bacterium]|nr:class I SAM-dependent methyltransferase [Alphaproteobacteria bacterium]
MDDVSGRPSNAPLPASLPLLASFVAAVFLSALLLFAVQPMFARMVLPRFGGSPAVWSVAMVFFQSMLLAGYAYAHYLMRVRLPVAVIGIHLALMAVAGLTLPLSLAEGWSDPQGVRTEFWLLGLFAVSIGLPFFALSANNPLLQAWFARAGHRDSKDPYFLYAASNIGSFLALLSYPVLMEPLLTLREQGLWWSGGYWLLFAAIAWCGVLALRARAGWAAFGGEAAQTPAPNWRVIGRWMFLAAVPSGLLVAVTAHISTDVAAAPLLWVVPLSLYLLTWVLVFQSKPLLPHRWMMAAQPFAIAGLVGLLALELSQALWLTLSGHLIAFFVIAMAAHGELARLRPPADRLTGFYLSLSAGGMIGGLFAGLIAPQMFSWVAEYPILIALACLCRPVPEGALAVWKRPLWLAAGLVAAAAVLLPALAFEWTPGEETIAAVPYVVLGIAVASMLLETHPLAFALAIALALAIVRLYPVNEESPETVRSFFGVHKIYDTSDYEYRILMHGTTVHGAQKLDDEGELPKGRPEPLAYYHSKSAMAQVINAVRKRKSGPLRVGVVGLGSGSLACYVEPKDNWTFFEIDPAVAEIARQRFSFVQGCAPDVKMVIGDGRLTLTKEPDGAFDLLIVDAYSSDAIPVHLATREAMALYKSKTAPDGAILLHISNRHLALASVVAGIAAANGLKTWINDGSEEEDEDHEYKYSSEVAAIAAAPEAIGELAGSKAWVATEPAPGERVWTDDYSNILNALIKRYR